MFYTREELEKIGFKSLGSNVLISDKCSIYGANKISIGNNVRIDDFCILSAGKEITIGDNIHIACYASLIGAGSIILEDFVSIAARCNILSSCDDFSGEYLTNPMIDKKYLNVRHDSVIFRKHSLLGVGTVVLPGVELGEGATAGAMSFVKKSIKPFEIWVGNPIRFIKMRSQKLLELEKQLNYEKQR
jgi:galactoside O-acetyltransferase